ncbi:hypothetical protein AV530_014733 [Patagioenas fasciata monilis]|uniref:Uncharacterized protein n=1 Tax=Patagioenas fasciata monilis TaxID=372326 RepID=A0A1V4KME3_PATFA|nr:hypothetical protein AV530_014733 [Patagioenas fasciata monilis]
MMLVSLFQLEYSWSQILCNLDSKKLRVDLGFLLVLSARGSSRWRHCCNFVDHIHWDLTTTILPFSS